MNNAAGDPLSLSEIQYYCRHQLYGTAIAACDTHLRKKGENGQITVLKAFAMTVLGEYFVLYVYLYLNLTDDNQTIASSVSESYR
jgi:hypothetical protein